MATLIVHQNTSQVADAEAIRNAVKGFGTDETAIIKIICHRNAAQRQLIRQAYQESYHEDLLKRLESDLKGPFESAVYRWMLDPAERDAVLANVAMKCSSPDYPVFIELSCIYSPEELLAVKRAYQARYKHSMEEDLAIHASGGDLGKLLVALVGIYRYDGPEIDARLATSEAGVLHHAIKDQAFNNEEVIRIMTTRSKAQLLATFNRYKDDYGDDHTSITEHLVSEPDSHYLEALRAIVKSIDDPHQYYEKELKTALHKPDDDAITRLIVTRAEKDLMAIKELYYKRNSVTLDQAVTKATSGDYEAFLLRLLGKDD